MNLKLVITYSLLIVLFSSCVKQEPETKLSESQAYQEIINNPYSKENKYNFTIQLFKMWVEEYKVYAQLNYFSHNTETIFNGVQVNKNNITRQALIFNLDSLKPLKKKNTIHFIDTLLNKNSIEFTVLYNELDNSFSILNSNE